MNKTDLIKQVVLKTELTEKEAKAAVNATFDSILHALKNGDKV
ncbi:HU family DNA-binding protein, partial [Bacillus sp. JJ722]